MQPNGFTCFHRLKMSAPCFEFVIINSVKINDVELLIIPVDAREYSINSIGQEIAMDKILVRAPQRVWIRGEYTGRIPNILKKGGVWNFEAETVEIPFSPL